VFFEGVRRLLMVVPQLPLWIDVRATAGALAILALAFYTLVTGAALATVRSMLMMIFGLVGVALGRRNTPVIAVAAAVLLLLTWSPLVISDISFQLSVVSVLALAVLVPRLLPSRRDTTSKAPFDVRVKLTVSATNLPDRNYDHSSLLS
jgi:competence protein ComEC